jgi:hypothetical protein
MNDEASRVYLFLHQRRNHEDIIGRDSRMKRSASISSVTFFMVLEVP